MKKLDLSGLNKLSYGETLRPTRDWLVLLVVAFLLILSSVVWNLWTFTRLTQGEAFGTEVPTETGNSSAVETVITIFEKRAAEEARYRNEYRFVDPSGAGR